MDNFLLKFEKEQDKFLGAVLLIFEDDMKAEGEALKNLLIANGCKVATWKDLKRFLQPGLPIMQSEALQKAVAMATSYVIIPSSELKHGQASSLIYLCLQQVMEHEKPIIPVKFQKGDTGFVFLDLRTSVDFYSHLTDENELKKYMFNQVRRLMWGLGIIDHL